jgi:hypothetical protein
MERGLQSASSPIHNGIGAPLYHLHKISAILAFYKSQTKMLLANQP